ncbi:MAG TPA: hypothetical protein DCM30_07575, partial [Acinetobacter radioresistens]|nr:hypothetical protein [Acinetobacter radioresistens]
FTATLMAAAPNCCVVVVVLADCSIPEVVHADKIKANGASTYIDFFMFILYQCIYKFWTNFKDYEVSEHC